MARTLETGPNRSNVAPDVMPDPKHGEVPPGLLGLRVGRRVKLSLPSREFLSSASLTGTVMLLAAAIIFVAAMGAVSAVTWSAVVSVPVTWAILAVLALALGTVAYLLRLGCDEWCLPPRSDVLPDKEALARYDNRNRQLYMWHQVGVGFALLLLGVVSVVGLAGLAWMNRLDSVVSPASKTPPGVVAGPGVLSSHQICAVRLLLTMNMAVLGSLFFIANSLRKKRVCNHAFDVNAFWGGLWYRIGEAILFTLVFFLVFRKFEVTDSDLWLPMLGLLIGMFIQSGEGLVFGIAERVFKGISAMIPVDTALTTQGIAGADHAGRGESKPDGSLPRPASP